MWSFQLVPSIAKIFSRPGYPFHTPNTVVPNYSAAMHAKYEVPASTSSSLARHMCRHIDMQTHADNCVTLTFDLLTSGSIHTERLPCTECPPNLVLIAHAVLLLQRGYAADKVTTDHRVPHARFCYRWCQSCSCWACIDPAVKRSKVKVTWSVCSRCSHQVKLYSRSEAKYSPFFLFFHALLSSFPPFFVPFFMWQSPAFSPPSISIVDL